MSAEVHQLQMNHLVLAAGTAEVYDLEWSLPGTWKLTRFAYMPQTNRTANGTNYTTISMEIAAVEVGTFALDTVTTDDLTAGTTKNITITGTGTQLEVSPGTRISFKKTETGTGLALDGTYCTAWEKVRA